MHICIGTKIAAVAVNWIRQQVPSKKQESKRLYKRQGYVIRYGIYKALGRKDVKSRVHGGDDYGDFQQIPKFFSIFGAGPFPRHPFRGAHAYSP